MEEKGEESWPANPIWPTQELIARQEPHPQQTPSFSIWKCACTQRQEQQNHACAALPPRAELWNESHHLHNERAHSQCSSPGRSRVLCVHRAGHQGLTDTSSGSLSQLFPALSALPCKTQSCYSSILNTKPFSVVVLPHKGFSSRTAVST